MPLEEKFWYGEVQMANGRKSQMFVRKMLIINISKALQGSRFLTKPEQFFVFI